MSQISMAPLRTTYWVFQIGSKLARSACGTKRSARAAARWEMAGAANALAATAAAAFTNVLRSIVASDVPAVGVILVVARFAHRPHQTRKNAACRAFSSSGRGDHKGRPASPYGTLHGLAHPPEERQRALDHARDVVPPSLILQEEAGRRVDHGLKRRLVKAADRGLFLVEILGVIPGGNLRFDLGRIGPAEPGLVAARPYPDRDRRIDAVGAGMPGVEHLPAALAGRRFHRAAGADRAPIDGGKIDVHPKALQQVGSDVALCLRNGLVLGDEAGDRLSRIARLRQELLCRIEV